MMLNELLAGLQRRLSKVPASGIKKVKRLRKLFPEQRSIVEFRESAALQPPGGCALLAEGNLALRRMKAAPRTRPKTGRQV